MRERREMKKNVFVVLMVTVALASSGMTAMAEEVINTDADFAVDYPAAPAVAGLLLEEAGTDNRYGSGRDGGNYIRDVAHEMGAETDFWGVLKTDVIAYECAVAEFLREQSAPVTASGTGVVDAAASGAAATDNADGTTTLVITVVDLCGDPITGLVPTNDFYVMDSVIGGPYYFGTTSIPASGADKWVEADGTYTVTLERNFFDARPAGYEDGWYRVWSIYVKGELVEPDLMLKTSYYAVGNWEMDLSWGSNEGERFVIIATHDTGTNEINGFFGLGYDAGGTPSGTITGTIVGQTIYMFYDRDPINYTAVFDGTIADDGNSMSGTWQASSGTTGTWVMRRG
jgi:hypothetical protein